MKQKIRTMLYESTAQVSEWNKLWYGAYIEQSGAVVVDVCSLNDSGAVIPGLTERRDAYSVEQARENLDYMTSHTYRQLVQRGEYDAARLVLRFLRRGYTTLGLSDHEWAACQALEKSGYRPRYDRRGNTAQYALLRVE